MALEDPKDIDLASRFVTLKNAFAADPYPGLATRKLNLKRLADMLSKNGDAICVAIGQDFSTRPRQETELAELHIVQTEIAHLLRSLRKWMSPRRVSTSLTWLPGTSMMFPQPKGVVGIVSPWNYPVQLALAPLAAALAAGNRVFLKPSEQTPHTAELLAKLIGQTFPADLVEVAIGDAQVAANFVALPFDHLFFTGSTWVGRQVAVAAAQNLTPVTLELGGKCPAIIDRSANIKLAAERIVHGKLLNAGQTCVAPDYVLVDQSILAAFCDAAREAARRFYPSNSAARDLSGVLGEQRRDRLETMCDEAKAKGATIMPLLDNGTTLSPQHVMPRLAIEPPRDCQLMREEIFGPIVPVLPVASADAAIAFVRGRDHPLALYWFGSDDSTFQKVARQTHAGGVTVNGTIWHIVQDNLPFGGVGVSGMGAYHGHTGFRLFSHDKPVFRERRLSGAALLRPPFGKLFDLTLNLVGRIA
jgi:coniferyl-aldehyde dehydrogenase